MDRGRTVAPPAGGVTGLTTGTNGRIYAVAGVDAPSHFTPHNGDLQPDLEQLAAILGGSTGISGAQYPDPHCWQRSESPTLTRPRLALSSRP
jgi:hypothetical protein